MPRQSLRPLEFARSVVGSKSPPRASSPTFTATTNASQMDLSENVHTIITRADLRASLQAYDNLVDTCSAYRAALLTMSRASSDFANAIDACARLKGVTDDAGMNLQAAGGLHYLMANHWDVLGNTLEEKFEEPLRQHLVHYRSTIVERSAAYERTLYEKSRTIRQTEAENLNFGRRKKRDLQSFRQALSVLQAEIDELDRLKVAHYSQVLEHEEQVWDVVTGKVCLVVRSSLEVFDRVTSKASDSVLEAMVQSIPDPFDSYGPPKKEDQIYSILAPLAMVPGDALSESAPPWADDSGVAFPRSQEEDSELDDSTLSRRMRRHSAPITTTVSALPSPPATTSTIVVPSPKRHAQTQPSVLTVIDETQGHPDIQESPGEEQSQLEKENSVSSEPHVSNDITPTNTLRRPSVGRPRAPSPPGPG